MKMHKKVNNTIFLCTYKFQKYFFFIGISVIWAKKHFKTQISKIVEITFLSYLFDLILFTFKNVH